MPAADIDYFAAALSGANHRDRRELLVCLADEISDETAAAWLRSEASTLSPLPSMADARSRKVEGHYWCRLRPNEECYSQDLPESIFDRVATVYASGVRRHYGYASVLIPSQDGTDIEAWRVLLKAIC